MFARAVRRCVIVLLCGPLLLLGACSDDPDQTTAGTTPGPAPTATETTARPDAVLPDAARSPDVAGAKEFVRHWVDVLNRATQDGDASRLRALGPNCAECTAIADGIDDLKEAGGYLTTEGWRVMELLAEPDAPAGRAALALRVLRSPEALTPSAGAEPKYFEGGRERYTVQLAHDGTDWQVTRLARWTR